MGVGGDKGPVSTARRPLSPLAPDLDRKQPSGAQTLAGQLKARVGRTLLGLTSSLLMTLLTPCVGKHEEPGPPSAPPPTPCHPAVFPTSLFSPFCLPTFATPPRPCCATARSANTCCLSPEAPPHGFLLLRRRRKAQCLEGGERKKKKEKKKAQHTPLARTSASKNSRSVVHCGPSPAFREARSLQPYWQAFVRR